MTIFGRPNLTRTYVGVGAKEEADRSANALREIFEIVEITEGGTLVQTVKAWERKKN